MYQIFVANTRKTYVREESYSIQEWDNKQYKEVPMIISVLLPSESNAEQVFIKLLTFYLNSDKNYVFLFPTSKV